LYKNAGRKFDTDLHTYCSCNNLCTKTQEENLILTCTLTAVARIFMQKSRKKNFKNKNEIKIKIISLK
jgi:hypothetical protein